MRLFVGLSIPQSVAQSLMLLHGGVPGARWQSREQLHLTLAFIGDVDGNIADDIDEALAGIAAPDFSLQLHGVGQFGDRQPHSLWADVRPNPALDHLQRKVVSAIRRIGTPPDKHKFTPHVTVARLKHPEQGKVIEWLTHNALYTSPSFRVDGFQLYSSRLTSDGSVYAVEREYPLEITHDQIAD